MSTKPPTQSRVTSYYALFGVLNQGNGGIQRVEVPIIQRDYAQGRENATVKRIRTNFLDVLYRAVTGGTPVSLDFVYGDVHDGTLQPLDGQQRLTTLFLLHWYVASRAGHLMPGEAWQQFSYATRASARRFCQELGKHALPPEVTKVREWVEDQAWYLQTWQHDATIQAMLVMLEAMRERFEQVDVEPLDFHAAWQRLISVEAPAVFFHLLPVEGMGLSEDLYVKMNSRGKPLTAFETFKAYLEQRIGEALPDRLQDFAKKVDIDWVDLFWSPDGARTTVDDEMLRYFHFVLEVCAWREGDTHSKDPLELADVVFAKDNVRAAEHLEFLIQAFECWIGVDISGVFNGLFATAESISKQTDSTKVVLFTRPNGVDLFWSCCEHYSAPTGEDRPFGWSSILYLYAVVLHRCENSTIFPRRLRMLRNLMEASRNELRHARMPALLEDVRRLVVEQTLEGVSAFNQAQVRQERDKEVFLRGNPELAAVLFELEDHMLLQGNTAAFPLDAAMLAQRASAFHRFFSEVGNWPILTGALLCVGDYSRRRGDRFRFGSVENEGPWRTLLADAQPNTREVLIRLLDEEGERTNDQSIWLQERIQIWLATREEAQRFSWRYYMVKYPVMRSGRSGIYVAPSYRMDFELCMLEKTQLNSYYRDPFLSAVCREVGLAEPWFYGYDLRVLRLPVSGVGLQCVQVGWKLHVPSGTVLGGRFAEIFEKYGVTDDGMLTVEQEKEDECISDTCDRVQLAAQMMWELERVGV